MWLWRSNVPPRGFSLGPVVMPFLVFLALDGLWPPTTQTMWTLEVASAIVGGLALGRIITWLFHKLCDARIPV